jgi:O-acetylhomoserine/O-acetylserine sulfhydrylase-like pyridoxal-dependent enzyme
VTDIAEQKVKGLVIHPASTTRSQLSVGVESIDDILYDLDQALNGSVKTE